MLGRRILGIAAVQVAVISDESWQSFKASATLPFAVGRVTEKSKQSRWATASDSLPWFILVDGKGKVAAEGFSLDELEPEAPETTQVSERIFVVRSMVCSLMVRSRGRTG